MKKVVKFASREEGKQFVQENPDFKLMVIFTKGTGEKVYFAYNKKTCPPVNNALLEHWEREGLI